MGQAGAAALLRCARELGAVEAFSMPEYSAYAKQYDTIIVSFYKSIQLLFALHSSGVRANWAPWRPAARDGMGRIRVHVPNSMI